ncbi:MFS transporter [Streptomyces sp. NPDC007088]|uniref:MFS transporter n=1 Tax=Streptomyces sp. NPDC007088 TaxID=3364773 RepID=UPI00367C9DFD
MFPEGAARGEGDGTGAGSGSRAPAGMGRDFSLVWASVAASGLGDGVRFVALPLLAARLTDDPRQLAAVALAEQLPWLLSVLAGALADRADRRRLLWAVDLVRAVVVGALAAGIAAGGVTVAVLITTGFLLGCGQTLYLAAWSGLIPSLVGRARLAPANARLQSTGILTDTLLGPPLGAVLFGAATALPVSVDAVSFAMASGLVLLSGAGRSGTAAVPAGGSRPSRPGRPFRAELLSGTVLLWQDGLLRGLSACGALAALVTDGLAAVLVLWARRTLHLDDLGYALLVAAFAAGGVTGAAVAPRLPVRGVVRACPGVTALAAAGAALAHSGLLAGGCLTVYGAAFGAWGVHAATLRQSRTPTELLGRVGVAHATLTGAAGAVGTAAAGLLAAHAGLRAPFAAGAVLMAVGAALMWGTTGREAGPPAAGDARKRRGAPG